MMHEDYKVLRPSLRRKNPTEKYNVKEDLGPCPVACVTSRPKLVSKQTNGAFVCVRPKLVQKKKSRYNIF